jgi:hypothetical protein
MRPTRYERVEIPAFSIPHITYAFSYLICQRPEKIFWGGTMWGARSHPPTGPFKGQNAGHSHAYNVSIHNTE